MKKLLNKSIGLVLAVFLFVSLLVAGAATIDFLAAETESGIQPGLFGTNR